MRMKHTSPVVCLLVFGGIVPSAQGAVQPCHQLAQLSLPNAKVTLAHEIAAGSFTPPSSEDGASLFKQVPAFCRVMIEDKPTPDSDIRIEVWLPVAGWNGKFRCQGSGGFAGEIDYQFLGLSVMKGYASADTD